MTASLGSFCLRIGAAAVVIAAASLLNQATAQEAEARPPQSLAETGLYSDAGNRQVSPRHLAFAPQYPLWSDGAAKRRWISVPAGTTIDGSDPEAWEFPIGTRFWKEFSFAGRPVETRYMERRPNGQWLYAAYTWTDSGEALLTSEYGKRAAYAFGSGRSHTIPSVSDCKVCHQGGRTEVLGFSTLQLSRQRDPEALHAEPRPEPDVDIDYLVEKGILAGFPKELLQSPPRIVAASPTERIALGYMHGNCGHCHNDQGSLKNLGLFLRHVSAADPPPAVTTTVAHPIKKAAPGQSADAVLRILPGRPDRSGLLQRVASRYGPLQMPPLGTELVDTEAVTVMRRWISELLEVPGSNTDKGKEKP